MKTTATMGMISKMPNMKTVTVTLVLYVEDDQPVIDWLPDVITEQLQSHEELLEYTDDEPEV